MYLAVRKAYTMRFNFSYVLILLVLASGCRTNHGDKPKEASQADSLWSITSTKVVSKKSGLLNVESIVYDKSKNVLYTSNGEDYKPGVSGFISKISLNGEVENLHWVSNLNRPTGMAIKDSILYVADVNALLAINTNTAEVISRYKEPIANSGLNDVTVSENGEGYVSASFRHAVFVLKNDSLRQWKQDTNKLEWANGVFAGKKQIVVGGLNLSSISMETKEIKLFDLNPNIKDFDGITSDGLGGYFLTTVENSGLFHMNNTGTITELMREAPYFGDLEYVPSQKTIYIPRGDHKTKDYFIMVLTIEKTE